MYVELVVNDDASTLAVPYLLNECTLYKQKHEGGLCGVKFSAEDKISMFQFLELSSSLLIL